MRKPTVYIEERGWPMRPVSRQEAAQEIRRCRSEQRHGACNTVVMRSIRGDATMIVSDDPKTPRWIRRVGGAA